MQYTLVGTDEASSVITVFVPGGNPLVAHSSHPNFEKIVAGVIANDEKVVDLFDVAKTAATKFDRLTERVTTANGRLFLDGEEINNVLAEQVVRFLSEGVEDWKPLVKFFENVQNNPNEHSREQLYGWLSSKQFTITDEGHILGYKGVQDVDGQFLSIHSGRATVDGEVKVGHIPNHIGAIVEMPRNEVTHDPTIGCHTGLHVGTYDYARGYSSGGAMLEVHVNPRDVVSVPTDGSDEKMRVCRYTVVKTLDAPVREAVVFGYTYDLETDEFEDDDLLDGIESILDEIDPENKLSDDEYIAEVNRRLAAEGIETAQNVQVLEDETPEEPVADLEDVTVQVGDVYENTDTRRTGTSFKVESIEGDHAVGKSLPANITRKVRLDRLTSYRYKKV